MSLAKLHISLSNSNDGCSKYECVVAGKMVLVMIKSAFWTAIKGCWEYSMRAGWIEIGGWIEVGDGVVVVVGVVAVVGGVVVEAPDPLIICNALDGLNCCGDCGDDDDETASSKDSGPSSVALVLDLLPVSCCGGCCCGCFGLRMSWRWDQYRLISFTSVTCGESPGEGSIKNKSGSKSGKSSYNVSSISTTLVLLSSSPSSPSPLSPPFLTFLDDLAIGMGFPLAKHDCSNNFMSI